MRPLLRLRDVSASYGRLRALQNVSLIVPEGSLVALLGPNGAGKSTLLRCVSGMMRPSSGSIELYGTRIDEMTPHAIAKRGVVHIPEGRGIFPSLTVRENLTMARASDQSERIFELFPALSNRLSQLAGTLSGGEQQMLALARAVAKQPRLLMVDELSLGLAPIIVNQLFGVLRTLRDQGSTILLVEQYVKHAFALADIVIVLQKGRIKFIGEPGELQQDQTLVASYLGQAAGGEIS
ncbi:MAG: ABC transporter ATP-binding protein [Actinomycetota bacterium]